MAFYVPGNENDIAPISGSDITKAFQNQLTQADWQRQQNLTEAEAQQRGVYVHGTGLGPGTIPTGGYGAGTTPGGTSPDDQYLGGVAAAYARQPNSGMGNTTQSEGGAFAMPSDFTPGVTGSTQFQPQRGNNLQAPGGAGYGPGNMPQGGMGNPAQFNPVTGNFGSRPPINQGTQGGAQQPPGSPQMGGQGGTAPQAPSPQIPGSSANGNLSVLLNAAQKAQAQRTQQQTGTAPGAGGAPVAGQGQPQGPSASDPYGLQTGQNTLAQYIQQKQAQVSGAQGAYQTAQAGLNTPVPLPNSQSLADQGIQRFVTGQSGSMVDMAQSPAGLAASEGARQAANTQALLTNSRQVTSAQDAMTLLAAADQQMTTLESQRATLQQSAAEGNRSSAIQIMGINLQMMQLQRMHDQFMAQFALENKRYNLDAGAKGNTQMQPYAEAAQEWTKVQPLLQQAMPTAQNPKGNPEALAQLPVAEIQILDKGGRLTAPLLNLAGPQTKDMSVQDRLARGWSVATSGQLPPAQFQGLVSLLTGTAQAQFDQHQRVFNGLSPDEQANATKPGTLWGGRPGGSAGGDSGSNGGGLRPVSQQEYNQIQQAHGLTPQQMSQYYSVTK